MTEVQFEMQTIYGCMLQEGVSKDEALAYILIMGYEPADFAWLVRKVS